MAKIIIPHEYILGGTGFEAEKDKAIDVRNILSIDRIFTHNHTDYTSIEYRYIKGRGLISGFINVNLQVYEVCVLIADAFKSDTLLLDRGE